MASAAHIQAIEANTAKVSADGSVTTHNDVTDAGSGAIITTTERDNLNNKAVLGKDTLTENTVMKADANGDATDSSITDDGTDVTVSAPVTAPVYTADTSYTETGSEPVGSWFWDADAKTNSVVLEDGVKGQMFEELFMQVQNDTGSIIPNGSLVTYGDSIGNSGNIRGVLTVADVAEPTYMTLGIATQDIANGGVGKVTVLGKVRGIPTNGADVGETWAEKDILYKSTTNPGKLTNVQPDAPTPAIPVAVVLSVHANSGTILVRPTFPCKLTGLADVNGTPLTTNGQILVWDNDNGYFDFTVTIETTITDDDAKLPTSGAVVDYVLAQAHAPVTLNADDPTQQSLNLVGQEIQAVQATPATDGVMSAEDKSKLDGVADNANAYVHPNHSGDVTSVGDGAQTIEADVVDNTKLANMPANTIKGNDTAGAADPQDLTAAEVRALLSVYTQAEVDALVDPTLKSPEAYDPTITGEFPVTYEGNAVQKGDSFRITAAQVDMGTTNPITVNAEDLLIALIDTPAQDGANWMVAESNRDQATEAVKGVAQIAAAADMTAETDDTKIVTPAKLGTYATMNADTSLVGNGYFLDEDDMVSDDATKVPSQQSVKAYVDDKATNLLHNDRSDLQGGTADEYYHLTATEHATYTHDIYNVVGHGFSTGDPVYNNAGTWTAAQADDRETLTQGVVLKVDDDNFIVISHGKLPWTGHGFPVGEFLFLDALTSALTATEPQGLTYLSDPVAQVEDANTLTILPYRPSDSIPRSNDLYHKTITFADSPYTVQDIDEFIKVDTSGGNVEILANTGEDYDGFTFGVKKITSDANTVTTKTVAGAGEIEAVAGATGRVISSHLAAEKYSCDGTDYWIAP